MPLGVKDDHVPRVIDGVVPVVRRDLRKGHADLGPVGGGVTALGSRTVGLDIEGQIGNVTVTT